MSPELTVPSDWQGALGPCQAASGDQHPQKSHLVLSQMARCPERPGSGTATLKGGSDPHCLGTPTKEGSGPGLAQSSLLASCITSPTVSPWSSASWLSPHSRKLTPAEAQGLAREDRAGSGPQPLPSTSFVSVCSIAKPSAAHGY